MIKILLFAGIAEKVGKTELQVVKQDVSVGAIVNQLVAEHPEIEPEIHRALIAVNEEFVDKDTTLRANDVVAFIPPVSGG